MVSGAMIRTRVTVILLTAANLLIVSFPAHAYLDPGTGSMMTTAILALLAAIVFTFRKYLYKFMRMIRGGNGDSKPAAEAEKDPNRSP